MYSTNNFSLNVATSFLAGVGQRTEALLREKKGRKKDAGWQLVNENHNIILFTLEICTPSCSNGGECRSLIRLGDCGRGEMNAYHV